MPYIGPKLDDGCPHFRVYKRTRATIWGYCTLVYGEEMPSELHWDCIHGAPCPMGLETAEIMLKEISKNGKTK
jgi:hypothetical protein